MSIATGSPGLAAVGGALKRLYETGDLTDFVIKCGEREWKVHKLILSLYSEPLSKAANGEWSEAQGGTLRLEDDDGDCVDAMIQFFYHGDYTFEPTAAVTQLVSHVRTYVIADKYDVVQLKELAIERFKACAQQTASESFLVPTPRPLPPCFSKDFTYAVREAYDNSMATSGIRAAAMVIILKNPVLLHEDQIGELRELMLVQGDFAAEVAIAFATDRKIMLSRDLKMYEHCPGFRFTAKFFDGREFCCPACGGRVHGSAWHGYEV